MQGYSDRILEAQQQAVEIGYWTAYYSHAKHPKSVSKIFEAMRKATTKKEKKYSSKEPDVAAFEALEQKRLEMLERRGTHG